VQFDGRNRDATRRAVRRLPLAVRLTWSVCTVSVCVQYLQTLGTDFSLMERLFPGRSRRQLKNKFVKETRVNPSRVDQALSGSAADTETYTELMDVITDGQARHCWNIFSSGSLGCHTGQYFFCWSDLIGFVQGPVFPFGP
jgi:Myb DNA-binding like